MRLKYKNLFVWFGVLVAFATLVSVISPAKTSAAINTQINFQGKLANPDGTNVTDGNYSIVFSIYTVASGGTAAWTETQSTVAVSAGNFQVQLGSVNTNLATQVDFNGSALYLGIKVGSDAEMTPRVQLTAAPYAFNSDKVGGISAAGLIQLGPGSVQNDASTNVALFLNKTGATGNILQLQKNGADVLTVANNGAATFGSTVNIQSSAYTTSQFVLNNGQTSAIPAYPNSYAPTLVARVSQTTGSRPLFFGYDNGAGTGWASFLTAGACGAYTQMCFDLGNGTTALTALENIGTTLKVGGGDDGNFTDITFANSGTATFGSAAAFSNTAAFSGVATFNSTSSFTGAATFSANTTFNGATALFQNTTDSAAAFTIQAASTGPKEFSVDTANDKVSIGSGNTDTTQVLFQFDSFSSYADTASCSTTNNQGAMYYNTTTNTMRFCGNGSWEDMVSTGGLGIIAFGIVSDSSNAGTVGDIAGVSGYSNSPCKVVWTAAQQVTVEPCIAYSGGRKVIIPATPLSTTGIAVNSYMNVCLTGANGQPAFGTVSTTETAAGLPAFSANNPVLCLATVRIAAATAGNVGFIWDTRTFTNTTKQFTSMSAANSNGMLALGTTTLGVTSIAATAAQPLRGVIVATSGAGSSTTVNAIIATNGLAFVKFASGATATINNSVQSFTTTAGYGTSVASTTTTASAYAYGGPLLTSISTSCASTNTVLTACQYSPLVDFRPSR